MSDDRQRDPQVLLRALKEALEALAGGADQVAALQGSFGLAMTGLGAEKGLLLYVRHQDPVQLEILQACGLSPEQQEACRQMESVAEEGVSPTVIRDAIATRGAVYIPNAMDAADKWQTTSLAGAAHSVLCAPVHDPATKATIAVLYFQNRGLTSTFESQDLDWLKAYALALSQGLGLHLAGQRRISELERAAAASPRKRRDAPVFVGDSLWTQKLLQKIELHIRATARENPHPILVGGPSGSGKEVIARYLHYYSPTRSAAPFVPFNCAGFRGDGMMLASQLFGHIRGSFTGAVTDREGLFRESTGGILFLDEIGDMPLETQGLLLRVLQERVVQPVGTSKTIPVNVQCVFATNRSLQAMVEEGAFRLDLLHRIQGLKIDLLPLSDPQRRSDIRPLLTHFLQLYEREDRKRTGGLTTQAFNALMAYGWPGNVREVSNVCSVLVAACEEGARIDITEIREHCPQILEGPRFPDAEQLFLGDDITYEEARLHFMRELFRRRIELHGGNMKRASLSLGIRSNRLLYLRQACGLAPKAKGAGGSEEA